MEVQEEEVADVGPGQVGEEGWRQQDDTTLFNLINIRGLVVKAPTKITALVSLS